MTRRIGLASAPSRFFFCLVSLSLLLLPDSASATGGFCFRFEDGTPADPAPSSLWNALRPTDTVIPTCQTGCTSRDSSWDDKNGNFGMQNPYWESVDVEENRMFVATNVGLQTWSLSNPTSPTRLLSQDIRTIAPFVQSQGHFDFVMDDIDAPDGDASLFVTTGSHGIGMLLVATAGGAAIYQDRGENKEGHEVYATRFGGRSYGFLAASGTADARGVWMYDLTMAEGLVTRPCLETVPSGMNPACAGVLESRLWTEAAQFVDGAGHFVVASGGGSQFNSGGFRIWNVVDPANPVEVQSGLVGQRIDGVALWQQSGKYYLALHNRSARQGQVYDVSCIAGGSCGSPSLEYSFPLVGFSSSGTIGTVTDSSSNGTPFVYFGSRLFESLSGLQEEWLLDMSPLSSGQEPQAVTGGDPKNGNQGQPTIVVDGETVGYWSYYYMCHPSGTNYLRPGRGKFRGNYFYRAAHGILDVHQRRSPGPAINVSGPSSGLVDQSLTLDAAAFNCTATAGAWSWQTDGGTIIGGSSGDQVTVEWADTGSKTVTASNTGCPGAALNGHMVEILAESPSSISVSGPSSLLVDESGTYTALATGCTPDPNGWTWTTTTGATGSSTTAALNVSWSSPGTKVVRASNSACAAATGQQSVTVSSTPGGELVAEFTIDPASPAAGQEITFDAGPSQGGPTSWSWDFGDGSAGSGEVTTHTYSQDGSYSVELTIGKSGPGCGSFGQPECSDVVTQTVVVGRSGTPCVPSSETLCLYDDRFQVTAHWRDQRTGDTGNAKVYTEFSSNKTGMFWFFRPDNVELIVKSLDGRTINGSWWFFYGGLSDVEYWITVRDTATGRVSEYHNQPGSICGFPDTEVFPEAPDGQSSVAASGWAGGLLQTQSAPASGTCTPAGDNLCLLDGRFSLEVDWRDQRTGDTGLGTPVVGTDRTGYFWFFNAQNIELVAKMIDASEPFGFYWVLWGGLSDVEYNLRVTDTVTGTTQVYTNPPGSFCGGSDTTAFEAD